MLVLPSFKCLCILQSCRVCLVLSCLSLGVLLIVADLEFPRSMIRKFLFLRLSHLSLLLFVLSFRGCLLDLYLVFGFLLPFGSFRVSEFDCFQSFESLETWFERRSSGLAIRCFRLATSSIRRGKRQSFVHDQHEALFLCRESLISSQFSNSSLPGSGSRVIFTVTRISQGLQYFLRVL